ncbi:MAG TPA: GntR family transcriptional regulator [Leifsonia sp.]|jgi:DNA-binding FadR family transcriptional regulator|nr:hypothetical protein [Microbacteriaceae bacterium]HEV7811712.1 GntR family transcriptional regulator [Leifsonia sp.]
MPQSTRARSAARAAVFAPLDGAGRAEVVERRLSDAILLGLLAPGERLPSEADLSRQFNVATVTAREALESLRGRGLVQTRRGRGGGSFVRSKSDAHLEVIEERVRGISRVELRDLGVHFAALAAMSAELAAERASGDDVEGLERLVASFARDTDGAARRAENTFRLEVAALSQSARLVRELLRLQAEFGPVLWLNLRDQRYRDRSAERQAAVVTAIAAADPAAARRATLEHIDEAVECLVDAKAELEARSP